MKSELSNHIYLDYAATTPLDPRVGEAMQPYFAHSFGNPSSTHQHGQAAEAAVENARQAIARVFNCQPKEVLFTSCGSESDNLALRGAALAARNARGANHLLISPVEHPAVSKTAEQLDRYFGFTLETLPVDEHGRVSAEAVKAMLRPETALVSVMAANNEIGTINPVDEIGQVCREAGVAFHTDAVQAAAHLPFDFATLPVDLISVGAHKLYGPKGVGALIVREGTPLLPIQTGGGQEHGLRAGTSNVPYLVGQAEAFRLAAAERGTRRARLVEMRDHLIRTVLDSIPDSKLTGHPTERLPNHASFAFKSVDGNELLMILDAEGFSCSSGSACKTGNPEPSTVLKALNLTDDWALGSLRVTLSHHTKDEELEQFIEFLPEAVRRVRVLRGMV
ncbi:MAG TPA: cysteine desulfurase family protein [Anaerolineales bacterium]|nr:cysteine desulfurase family protein [Anaerolineales bacterium]